MWRGIPRREVLIAVGDQRCERVHMVRVLYHGDLIRLARNRKEREGGGKKRKMLLIHVWVEAEKHRRLHFNSVSITNHKPILRTVWFVIKNTFRCAHYWFNSHWIHTRHSAWLHYVSLTKNNHRNHLINQMTANLSTLSLSLFFSGLPTSHAPTPSSSFRVWFWRGLAL